jgi:DNA-binding transcriptional MerR regulator
LSNRYLIKDLENLTGIKAHTIRIWEQRYSLLTPERGSSNIRYYSEDDLKKILNVNVLYLNGHKISKIAKYSSEELLSITSEIVTNSRDSAGKDQQDLIDAILAMDSNKIICILEEVFQTKGIIAMYTHTITPLLNRIGELWQLNTLNISHEHLLSNTLREFILSKTNGLVRAGNGKKVMLFLPEEEEHELPLLFYQYLLKDKGWECIYLGQRTPLIDFENSFNQINPNMVITSMIRSTSSKQFNFVLRKLLESIPEDKLCLSGSNTVTYQDIIPKKILTIHSLSDFVRIFD